MTNINKLYATLLLIRYSISPPKGGEQLFFPPENGSTTVIPPAAFSAAIPDLNSLLRPDGTLELMFEEAQHAAAPFLLSRLKRNGFSNCRAIVNSQGILVTALR